MTKPDTIRIRYDRELEAQIQDELHKQYPSGAPKDVKVFVERIVNARVRTLITLKGQE